jgi:hypothetical protein
MFKALFAYLRSLFGSPEPLDNVDMPELAPLTNSPDLITVSGSEGAIVPERVLAWDSSFSQWLSQRQKVMFGQPEQPVWFDEDGITADNSEAVMAYVTKVTGGKVTEDQLAAEEFSFGGHRLYVHLPYDPIVDESSPLLGYTLEHGNLYGATMKPFGYSEGSVASIEMARNNPNFVQNLVLDKAPYGPFGLAHRSLVEDLGLSPMGIPMVMSKLEDVISGHWRDGYDLRSDIDSLHALWSDIDQP